MNRDEKIVKPIVRHNEPLVGVTGPSFVPSVDEKKPFVGIGHLTRGFTMLELFVTVTVVGILMMVAVPAMTSFVRSNRLAGLTNEFIVDLQLARSEAMKRGSNVVVCKSTDGSTCTAGGTWTSGWVVFADTDSSGTWTQTAGQEDIRLKVHEALSGDTAITAAAANTMIFTHSGIVSSGSGIYTICDPKLHKSRTLDLSPTGRVTLKDVAC
ncbi:MAG: GspH/FimT family pseudopilin [Sulfurifustis sp.]